MRNLITLSATLLIAANLSAQSPAKIGYQAVVRNSSNELMVNTEVGVRIQILQGSESGSVKYNETHTPVTNANGLFSVEIGSGTILSGALEDIDWSDGPYFLQIDIDPAGGTSYTITGKSQIVSVPYAFYADYAENLAGGYTETQGLGDVIAVNNAANGQIKNVTNPTDPQDAMTKAFADWIFSVLGIAPLNFSGTMTDMDGNIYKTVTIGDQVWMAENLRTTRYSDNTTIPLVTINADWADLTTPAYCWYGNGLSNSAVAAVCGALYNWYTVNTDLLCPTGWHVPSAEDMALLMNYLGGTSLAGGKLKENGSKNWNIPNTGATNESGFTALPCGGREFDGAFIGIGNGAMLWTSKNVSSDNGTCGIMVFNATDFAGVDHAKKAGFSVRCIKD